MFDEGFSRRIDWDAHYDPPEENWESEPDPEEEPEEEIPLVNLELPPVEVYEGEGQKEEEF